MEKEITINALKFDGKIHRSWKAEVVEQREDLLVLVGEFEKEVHHPQLGVIRRATLSYEYYWLDRWYNIFRFHEPEGDLRNFYCNISHPPKFENEVLGYVDFDIDILVWKDFRYEVLDLDEFAENSRRYSYPTSLVKKCLETVTEIEVLINTRQFPFDFIDSIL